MSDIATETVIKEQKALFDLSGQQVYADFYDAKKPVFLPNNPLHYKAHKLQLLIDNLENQSRKNASAFNSKNYLDAVDALMATFELIKEAHNEVLDKERMAASRNASGEATVGERVTLGMGFGISANNPLAG